MSQLYQTFNCELPSSDLKKTEKEHLIKCIQELDQVGSEIMFTLIYEHYIRTLPSDTSEKTKTPYGCKYEKGDVTFNLTKIPIPLRHILYRFVNMTRH